MPKKGNDQSPALTWPTTDELRRIYRASGRLLERIEKLEGSLRSVHTASEDDQQPTYEELGALTGFVSAIESDPESIGECVARRPLASRDRAKKPLARGHPLSRPMVPDAPTSC